MSHQGHSVMWRGEPTQPASPSAMAEGPWGKGGLVLSERGKSWNTKRKIHKWPSIEKFDEYKIQENAQIQNKKSTQYTLTTRHGNSSKVTKTWTSYLKCINFNNLWLKNNSIGTSTMLSLQFRRYLNNRKASFPPETFHSLLPHHQWQYQQKKR